MSYRLIGYLILIGLVGLSCGTLRNSTNYAFVKNKRHLLSILAAGNFNKIEIDSNAIIDLTGSQEIGIPANTHIYGGVNKRAKIITNQLRTFPLFVTNGDNILIEGIHIQGPDSTKRTDQMKKLHKIGKYYSVPNSQGLRVLNEKVVIDNCEFSGWSHAAIFVGKNAFAEVTNNHIHQNQRQGLGYGVCVSEGGAYIAYNVFRNNRHHIAGSGKPGSYYEACYNEVYESSSHAFDMHGGRDRLDGTNIAGDYVKIHNNNFYKNKHAAVMIGGKTIYKSEIRNNNFESDSLKEQIIILDK